MAPDLGSSDRVVRHELRRRRATAPHRAPRLGGRRGRADDHRRLRPGQSCGRLGHAGPAPRRRARTLGRDRKRPAPPPRPGTLHSVRATGPPRAPPSNNRSSRSDRSPRNYRFITPRTTLTLPWGTLRIRLDERIATATETGCYPKLRFVETRLRAMQKR